MTARHRRWGVLVAVVASIALAACGVEDEASFRPVSAQDIPFGLDDETPTTTTIRPTTTTSAPSRSTTTRPATTGATTTRVTLPPTTSAPTTTTTMPVPRFLTVLYFVSDGRLVPVERPAVAVPAPTEIVGDLVAGSAPTDSPAGLRSVLKPEHLASLRTGGGVVTVGITPDFRELPAGEQQLAIAQLVFTLTGLPGIGQVAFELDGVAIDVPRSDGSLAAGTVTRDDLAGVLGR